MACLCAWEATNCCSLLEGLLHAQNSYVSRAMAMKIPSLLLCCASCVLLFAVPGSGTLCPRGDDDPISLCAMCSDKYAAVRWNRSDAFLPRTMIVGYSCVDPHNSTIQVLGSGQDSCFDHFPPFSDLLTGVAAIGAEFATGVRCNFSIFYRYKTPVGTIHRTTIYSSCTVRSNETCETNPEECHLDQVCGAHEEESCPECYCTPGYSGSECININECAPNSTYTCHEQADCFDTEGSYECVCKAGFEGDGHNNCSDINECEGVNYPCHENAQCINTDGNFSCECKSGYTGDGYSNCSDIDECEDDSVCHRAANCINTIGSYRCECFSGYEGNGHNSCSDIDECGLIESPCHEDAECINTEGSYDCECRTGYEGDGYNCTDIDECSATNSTCPEAADCINIDGSYECVCWTGYRKVGYNCTESLPPSINVSVVVSGVVAGALLLVLLLSVLVLLNRYLRYRSDRLPQDILPVKDLDLFYTPTFSIWKGSMTSIHSVYEELQFPTSLSLFTKSDSTQELSTPSDKVSLKTLDNDSIIAPASPPPPPATVCVSSVKQEAPESSGCMTMSSQASDYRQVDDATVSKEPEPCWLSSPAIDTLSISDIIAAMEEDTSPYVPGQATDKMHLPNHVNPEPKLYDTLASITSSSATSTTQPQTTAIGYVHLRPQEFATAPVTSLSIQPLSTTMEYMCEEDTSTSPPQSVTDSGNGSLDTPLSDEPSSELAFGEWFSPQYTGNSISSGYVSESVASESKGYRCDSCDWHEVSSCSSHAMATAIEIRPHIVTDMEDTEVAIDKYSGIAQRSKQTFIPPFNSNNDCWQTSVKEPMPESIFDFDQAMDSDSATANHQFQYVNCIVNHVKNIQFDITPQTASV